MVVCCCVCVFVVGCGCGWFAWWCVVEFGDRWWVVMVDGGKVVAHYVMVLFDGVLCVVAVVRCVLVVARCGSWWLAVVGGGW